MKNIKKVLVPVLIGTILIVVIITLLLRDNTSYVDYVKDNHDLSNVKSNEEMARDYNAMMSDTKDSDSIMNDNWSLVVDWDSSYESLGDYLSSVLPASEYVIYSTPRFYPIGDYIADITTSMILDVNDNVLYVYAARCEDNKVYIYVYTSN